MAEAKEPILTMTENEVVKEYKVNDLSEEAYIEQIKVHLPTEEEDENTESKKDSGKKAN
jgi:hypothetical protein